MHKKSPNYNYLIECFFKSSNSIKDNVAILVDSRITLGLFLLGRLQPIVMRISTINSPLLNQENYIPKLECLNHFQQILNKSGIPQSLHSKLYEGPDHHTQYYNNYLYKNQLQVSCSKALKVGPKTFNCLLFPFRGIKPSMIIFPY